jgi:hypothetical protein
MKRCYSCPSNAVKGKLECAKCRNKRKVLERYYAQMQTGTIVGLELARVINQPKENLR